MSGGAGGGGNETAWNVTWTGTKANQPNPALYSDGSQLVNSAGAGGGGGAGGQPATPPIPRGPATPAVTTNVVRAGQGGGTQSDDQEITLEAGDLYSSGQAGQGGGVAGTATTGTVSGILRANNSFTTFIQGIVSAASAVIRVVVNGVATIINQVVIPVIKVIGTIVMRVVGAVVTLIRNGIEILRAVLTGVFNFVGALFRGAGFGSSTGSGTPPPAIRRVVIKPIKPKSRTGKVTMTNFGTQEGWPRFLCYGPGTFRIQNGPGTGNLVEFGPLVAGQIALLTTLPRLRGVVDLSPGGGTSNTQPLTAFQSFVKSLISAATNNNVPPLLELFQSLFGILPPQGEMYSLLKGRFDRPIPPKPAVAAPSPVSLTVQIIGGSASSKIIASLTPLRRWPE